MAKLSDLINIEGHQKTVDIQGIEIPVAFTMETMAYIAEAYGSTYKIFERDLNKMMKKKNLEPGEMEVKVMSSLLYGMVRSAGTETTPQELLVAIPFSQIGSVYAKAMEVFTDSQFEEQDLKKLKDDDSKK